MGASRIKLKLVGTLVAVGLILTNQMASAGQILSDANNKLRIHRGHLFQLAQQILQNWDHLSFNIQKDLKLIPFLISKELQDEIVAQQRYATSEWILRPCSSVCVVEVLNAHDGTQVAEVGPDEISINDFEQKEELRPDLWNTWGLRLLELADWNEFFSEINSFQEVGSPSQTPNPLAESLISDRKLSVVISYGYLDPEKGAKNKNYTSDIFLSKQSAAMIAAALNLQVLDSKGFAVGGKYIDKSGREILVSVAYRYSGVTGEWTKEKQYLASAQAYGLFRYGIHESDIVVYDGHSRYGTKIDFGLRYDSENPFKFKIGSVPFNLPIWLYPDAEKLSFKKGADQLVMHLGCNSAQYYQHRLDKIAHHSSSGTTTFLTFDGDFPASTGPMSEAVLVAGILKQIPTLTLQSILKESMAPTPPVGLEAIGVKLRK